MEQILINCPLNINRSISMMVDEFVKEEYKQNEFAIITEQHHLGHQSTLLDSLEKQTPPILYIGMPLDFAKLNRSVIIENFTILPQKPMRMELAERSFDDYRGIFLIFAVVPFAIIYNKKTVRQLPVKWTDLAKSHYKGKIRFPQRGLPVSQVTVANMYQRHPDKFMDFLNNCTFADSPIDVVNAVDNGEYDFGMVNLSFSRVSRHKNTALIWLADGAACMPLVVMVRKGELERVEPIIDYLFSFKVQEFMALQSFIPVIKEIEWPALVGENHNNIIWDGWNNFFASLKAAGAEVNNI